MKSSEINQQISKLAHGIKMEAERASPINNLKIVLNNQESLAEMIELINMKLILIRLDSKGE